LWYCDFFSQKVYTMSGFVEVFVQFFINLSTRRVRIAGITAQPDKPWMMQQARNAAMFLGEQPTPATMVMRANDRKFVTEFDEVLKDEGLAIKRIVPRSPNLDARAERFVQTIRTECLDHFLFFGEGHLRYLIAQSWVRSSKRVCTKVATNGY